MIKFEVGVRAESLQAAMRGYPNRLIEKLSKAMVILSLEVQRHVKENKLSGQVLHVRTGTLRRSINRQVFNRGSEIGFSVGTNVGYAAAHEYGFRGTVPVKEHLRKLKEGKRLYSVVVKAHSMKMNIPERSFLRSALKDYQGRAQKLIKETAAKALVE